MSVAAVPEETVMTSPEAPPPEGAELEILVRVWVPDGPGLFPPTGLQFPTGLSSPTWCRWSLWK